MKFQEFSAKFRDLPLLPTKLALAGSGTAGLNQLERWRKLGLVVRLRRGLYIFGEGERKIEPSRGYLAGQIYQPSYVSLEYALSRYGLIPERVADITSVTTKKTASFVNEFGTFVYQSVKPAAFRGFTALKDEAGLSYFMAEPEKAVADFVYLNLDKIKSGAAARTLLDSFRFQNLRTLRKVRLAAYFALFGVKKMREAALALAALAEER
ncbi:MAG: hypothetical protein WCK75_07750 [Elusimicrobiota bacterium]